MDKNPMTIDKKWNKWLIIGGLLAPVILFLLIAFLSLLFNPDWEPAFSLLLFPLGLWMFWFGVFNYSARSQNVKLGLSLLCMIATLVVLILLIFLIGIVTWEPNSLNFG